MFKDFSVLYVEDTPTIIEIFSMILSQHFKKIYIQENGEDALKFYLENKDKIDLVITDINMPKMNGIEMSKAIKADNQEIPIIVTSAYDEKEYLLEAIQIGINAYVTKPLKLHSLLENISRVLEPKILKLKLESQQKENYDKLLKSAKFSAIGQLAAGLTHEINTPLTYIKGSVEIMNRIITKLDDEKIQTLMRKEYKRINDGVQRIMNITDSMGEVAKKSTEEISATNIYETIVISCIMAYNRAKHIVNITINNEIFQMNMDKKKQTFNVSVQRQRIEQVWIIIINNALDELIKIENFDDRKLDITIEQNSDFTIVRFQDNAGGIKDEIFDSIFEPFKSTKDSSGMGVGLSIAKKIIVENQGQISVFNTDEGAVFEIKLMNNIKQKD